MAPPTPPFPDPIPGIIPFGSLVLLVGPPKCGKTALVATWMVRWRDGLTICGQATHTPPGLGIVTTDHKWALNQGIWFARAGFPDIPHVSLRDDRQLKWRSALRAGGVDDLLRACLRKLALPPGSLVVIDVAGVFITSRLNDYNDVLAGMGSLSQILDEFQLTGLGIGHMGKQKTDPKDRYLRPHERILGSGAQIGFSDTTMYLLGPEDTGNPYHTFGWLPTHAPAGEFHFRRDENGLFIPYEGLVASSPAPEKDRPTQIVQLIPDEGIATGDLETQARDLFGISRATFHRDLRTLTERQLISRDVWGLITRRKAN